MIGVYFLYYRKKLRYIGASINLEGRIRQHKNGGEIRFDWYSFVIVPNDRLFHAERQFIMEYKPLLNKQHTGRHGLKIYKIHLDMPPDKKKAISIKISNSVKNWYADPENKAFFMSRRKNRTSANKPKNAHFLM